MREHPLLTTILVGAALLVVFWIAQPALFDLGGSVPGSGEGDVAE